ncbi:MAG TPA: GNAT family N-acetyltransferase [Rhodocyclaceae bacterium]|nr:GNAT family N-acetyltransferase [Rhodocyclaceae bacterium]
MDFSFVSFEAVVAADADELGAIRIAAMRESLERIGRFDPQRARERFLATFDPRRTRYIVVDGVRVGFVVTRAEADCLFLNHLYVLPEHQGRGTGAQVLQHVFAEVDALRLPVRVGALRDSASNRFYLRHGFVKTHEDAFDIYYLRPPC